ncbi:fatty acid desaturase [Anderseniella sp. Alg231-50]|uniref:fatty acid desaturase n=1 Tax=Anderseniella sp. Alg231-50 TaxID=1922226 RepID=UPI000D555FE0
MPVLGTTRAAREWPTWVALAVCYTIWLSAIIWHDVLGWFWVIPAMVMATFHSSLQHEALHGHPTRSAALNEALVFPAIGLFVPYRRFRETHLRHHNNVMLTDPYDDPESWYLSRHDWHRTSPLMQALLGINSTLGGRILVGPALALYGFWRNDLKSVCAGNREIARAYLSHFAGVVPVVALLVWLDIPLWAYGLFVAYPAMSLLMIRTFIEHRAEETVAERTAVIEAGLFMRLLFLNNNFHAVHHDHPYMSWSELPAIWRLDKAKTLRDNGGYHYPGGYLQVAWYWLLRRREPVEHPFMRRNIDDAYERTFQPDNGDFELAASVSARQADVIHKRTKP